MTTVPMHLKEDLNTHLFLQSARNIALIPICIEVFPSFFSPVNDGQIWLEKDIIPLLSLHFMILSSHLPKRKKINQVQVTIPTCLSFVECSTFFFLVPRVHCPFFFQYTFYSNGHTRYWKTLVSTFISHPRNR